MQMLNYFLSLFNMFDLEIVINKLVIKWLAVKSNIFDI